jgi:hypothetical protein
MDPWIQIFGLFGQLMFYGGLLMLLFGLPLFIWLAVRACRDLHRIANALEAPRPPALASSSFDRTAEEYGARAIASIANSQFGR